MRFGPTPLAEAEGAILAHSMAIGAVRLKKGRPLTARDLDALRAAGVDAVTVARLEDGDLHEDAAAAAVAAALQGPGLSLSAPFTGRANLFAEAAGVLRVDAAAVAAANAAHEAVTVATLPDLARVAPRQMAATVKIIPYGAPAAAVAQAQAALAGAAALAMRPFALPSAALILTATPGMKPAVVDKGAQAVRARLAALGVATVAETRVAHETAALAAALRGAKGAAALILTGSATSDRRDVGPAAVAAAGGRVDRFGMPVDPGNLLFLGALADGRPVVGLPGCARSPKLNGADWVLERLAAGVAVDDAAIAAMGVGGLLKEIPSRPAPRAGGAEAPRRPHVTALLLAAGASRRMEGRDKLLEEVDGAPQIARAAAALAASRADAVVAVLRPGDDARGAALRAALPAATSVANSAAMSVAMSVAENPEAAQGMASSIRVGLAAAPAETDAVVVVLADMPELTAAHVDALIAAFDPEEGRSLCRAVDAAGAPGHPVLFGRRWFESLGRLEGDDGARALLAEHADAVELVPTPGRGASLDLDTRRDWEMWRASRASV